MSGKSSTRSAESGSFSTSGHAVTVTFFIASCDHDVTDTVTFFILDGHDVTDTVTFLIFSFGHGHGHVFSVPPTSVFLAAAQRSDGEAI